MQVRRQPKARRSQSNPPSVLNVMTVTVHISLNWTKLLQVELVWVTTVHLPLFQNNLCSALMHVVVTACGFVIKAFCCNPLSFPASEPPPSRQPSFPMRRSHEPSMLLQVWTVESGRSLRSHGNFFGTDFSKAASFRPSIRRSGARCVWTTYMIGVERTEKTLLSEKFACCKPGFPCTVNSNKLKTRLLEIFWCFA